MGCVLGETETGICKGTQTMCCVTLVQAAFVESGIRKFIFQGLFSSIVSKTLLHVSVLFQASFHVILGVSGLFCQVRKS